MNNRGRLVVIAAPSGGGKNTVIQRILKQRPDFLYSISTTTRPKRQYEKDGEHYHFITKDEFKQKIESNEFIEWEEVHGEYYGTERKVLETALLNGKSVLLDLDVNGGEAIQRNYPDDTIAIFLSAPSIDVLKERLRNRGSETEESIAKRLSRFDMETVKGKKFPHQIVNDNLDQTVANVLNIIDSHNNKISYK